MSEYTPPTGQMLIKPVKLYMRTSFTDDSLEDAHNSYGNVIVLVIGTHKHTLITKNTNSHTHTNI